MSLCSFSTRRLSDILPGDSAVGVEWPQYHTEALGLNPSRRTTGPSPSIDSESEGVFSGCLVQVGNGIELEAVGLPSQFEPYRWRPCGVTWDSSRTVVVIKMRRTSALITTTVREQHPGPTRPGYVMVAWHLSGIIIE